MLVWYAAYGSNLSAARLRAYLAGGSVTGARRRYRGARDRSPPREHRPLLLDRALYFGSGSPTWGGASAFLDHVPGAECLTYGRAYLVTAAQLGDLVAQECGLDVVDEDGRPTEAAPDDDFVAGCLEEAQRHGQARWSAGRYGTLLRLGDLDGRPLVTCTAPHPLATATLGAPAAAYLDVLVAGLAEAWGLDEAQARLYLSRCPGAAGRPGPAP